MGVLKYRKRGENTWTRLPSMMVEPINVVQTTGESTEDVMSQMAVTDELDLKQNIDWLYNNRRYDWLYNHCNNKFTQW